MSSLRGPTLKKNKNKNTYPLIHILLQKFDATSDHPRIFQNYNFILNLPPTFDFKNICISPVKMCLDHCKILKMINI